MPDMPTMGHLVLETLLPEGAEEDEDEDEDEQLQSLRIHDLQGQTLHEQQQMIAIMYLYLTFQYFRCQLWTRDISKIWKRQQIT